MRVPHFPFLLLAVLLAAEPPATPAASKEFLTPKEIEKIQDTQEVEARVKIYLEAAALRLKTAEDRLNGKESEPGDPLEFFSTEEMLDGYYQILRSVMMNLDSAAQNPATERAKLGKALKNLKESTERASKDLAILKKIAEEKKLEEAWNLVNKAVEITNGAHDGATEALKQNPAEPQKRKNRP